MIIGLFTDIEKSLLSNLKNTKKSLKIAVAWFTNPRLFAIVETLLNEGKIIELILADDSINFTNKNINFQYLIDNGLEIRISRFPNLMHHKFCIIDERLLISGSYNWTNNAELNNHENVIISNDLNLVSQFVLEFHELTAKTEKVAIIAETIFNTYISNIEKYEELNLLAKVKKSPFADDHILKEYLPAIEINMIEKELLALANLHYLQGKHQKAIDTCLELLVKYPNWADVYELIAAAKWRQGKYKEQIENAQKAIEINNLSYEAYNILGIGYAHIKNAQKSIENYQICIDANFENYVYYRNRAESYLDLEEDISITKNLREQFKKKANIDLLKIIELTNQLEITDKTYKLYYSRGVANFLLDKLIPAKVDLEKAIKIYESTDKFERDINELRDIKKTLKDIEYLRS
jgi:tetratricopeptide (TPR) repeat protein